MGIFLILAGAVFGLLTIVVFMAAGGAVPTLLIAGECAIVGAVLFSAGAIIDAVEKLRKAVKPDAAPKASDTSQAIG